MPTLPGKPLFLTAWRDSLRIVCQWLFGALATKEVTQEGSGFLGQHSADGFDSMIKPWQLQQPCQRFHPTELGISGTIDPSPGR